MEYEHVQHTEKTPFRSFLVRIGHKTHHLHADIEIICVLQGEITLNTGSVTHSYKKDDLFIINRYQIHSLEGSGDNILLITQIDPAFFPRGIYFDTPLLPEDISKKTFSLFAGLYLYTKSQSPGASFYITGITNIISGLLADYASSSTSPENTPEKSTDFARLKKIIRYIEEHYRENITLDDLSSHMHLNRYYLSRLIKNSLGTGFRDFLKDIRLTCALRLLFYTKENIAKIAEMSGFSDVKYLNALLREKYGHTAFDLRKKMLPETFPVKGEIKGSLHLPFDNSQAESILKEKAYKV